MGFARNGWYIGPTIELGRERRVLNFNWTFEFPNPAASLRPAISHAALEGGWGSWITPNRAALSRPATKYTYTVPFARRDGFSLRVSCLVTTTNPLSYTPILHRSSWCTMCRAAASLKAGRAAFRARMCFKVKSSPTPCPSTHPTVTALNHVMMWTCCQ